MDGTSVLGSHPPKLDQVPIKCRTRFFKPQENLFFSSVLDFGLESNLRAPVPLLRRVPVPGPRPGQNSLSGGLRFLDFFAGVSCSLATLDSTPAILIESNKPPSRL